ncbi:MAG: D-glycero-beta-D-manno-heptose 1-phosphate adenylyltransferase [Candidatus Krumholzibacteria bacterium]|nr:D-glycero-beta-D-manno-heptose 1-phosphate adenylyltransferase [Candidatus Krumholzibacteria bacterium]
MDGGRPGGALERHELAGLRARLAGVRIVFTNGCFDVLHRGHVELLATARGLGDCLVVGINSDDSVRRLKGPSRPVTAAPDRAFILLHLRSVDFVTVFDKDTPLETIAALRPDVLVKGAEYGAGEIVGEDLVRESGGRVVRIPMVEGYSSSELIDRIGRSREGTAGR